VGRVKIVVTPYSTAVLPINKTSPTQMLVIESPLKLLACNMTLHGRSILRFVAGYRTARGRVMKGQGAARSASQDIESVIYYANSPPCLGGLLCQFPYIGPRYSFRLNRTALVLDVLVQVGSQAYKGRFTHSMPCPCRSPAMPFVNSHIACRAHAVPLSCRSLIHT
jgi:hypothetical protein